VGKSTAIRPKTTAQFFGVSDAEPEKRCPLVRAALKISSGLFGFFLLIVITLEAKTIHAAILSSLSAS
jgi:hypothetical protein